MAHLKRRHQCMKLPEGKAACTDTDKLGCIAIVQDSDARVIRILTSFIGPYLAILMPFFVICLLTPSGQFYSLLIDF
jgi:hypothetical protein